MHRGSRKERRLLRPPPARDETRTCASHDDAAIEQWYDRYHARLRAFCDRRTGDRALAEDIAQETLVRAWSRREMFEPGGDIGPWLFRVARNLCTDHLRARARYADQTVLSEHVDLDADPSAPIERRETGELVRAALCDLTDRQREVLHLRDVEGVEYPELAARMGVSEGTARAVLFRARRTLRKRFSEVARALTALVMWPVIAVRDAARRHTSPAFAQPVAAVLGQASVALVAAALLATPASPGPAPIPASSAQARVEQVTEHGSRDETSVSPGAHESAGSPDGFSPAAASVSASRRGEVHARARATNPVTGDEAEVFANVWRETGEDRSTVLSAVDDANDTACGTGLVPCEAIDDTLGSMEAP